MKTKLVLSLVVCVSVLIIGTAMAASQNGRAGAGPAYYDAHLFTINLKHMPISATEALIEHNGSINKIYVVESSESEEENQAFIPVIDAIQGDGFNPLWQEVRIIFPDGITQFFSDDEILAAAAAGQIRLEEQDEMYRCSVIGPNKKQK